MTEQLKTIPIKQIHPNPYQPRQVFSEEELAELAQSIAENGLIQPIVVRQSPIAGYELIAGERRFRASQLAGLTDITAIIKDMSDRDSMKQAIIENLQRSDLNPIEEARAYQSLMEREGMTHDDIARSMGKSRPYISNSLRLLNLSEDAKKALIAKTISPGHARLLLSHSTKEQDQWLDLITEEGWTVRQLEEALKSGNKQEKIAKRIDPFVADQELALKKALGRSAHIKLSAQGRGSLILDFDSLDDFHNLFHNLIKDVDREN